MSKSNITHLEIKLVKNQNLSKDTVYEYNGYMGITGAILLGYNTHIKLYQTRMSRKELLTMLQRLDNLQCFEATSGMRIRFLTFKGQSNFAIELESTYSGSRRYIVPGYYDKVAVVVQGEELDQIKNSLDVAEQ